MAVRTAAGFKSTNASRIPDNSTGLVAPADVRNMLDDTADSFLNITDHLLDEDDMASNSATKVPSQQSVKAYVDGRTGSNAIETYSRIFEDFFAALQYFNLQAFNNGGGLGANPNVSAYGIDSTEHAIGIILMSTSTSTAGGSAIQNTTYQLTFGFGYTLTQNWRAALKDLSDGTDTFTVEIGFGNGTSSAPTNGAFFRYTHSVNSGKWQAVSVLAGTETAEDTGITAAVDGFHIFKIVANDDATQIDYYVDGVKTNDITTNIPSSSTAIFGYNGTIRKTAGSTAKGFYVDYFELIAQRTTAR